ncbi:MAG: tetratricopeptide repeat protein [Nitrospinales bacterium]
MAVKQSGDSSNEKPNAISQLGEELLKKFPKMVREAANIPQEEPSSRVVQIINDLLPYAWKDEKLFADGVGLCCVGNYADAINSFQNMLRLEPEAFPVYHFLGYARGKMGNSKGEIEYYRKSIKLNPDSPHIYCSLGTAYWKMGKDKKAIETFKQAVALANDFSALDYWLTFVISSIQPASKISSQGDKERRENIRSQAYVCYLLGNAYIEYGLHSAARQAFKRAIKIKPDFALGHFQLGHLHIKRLRNPKRAEKYLQKAEELFIEQNDLQKASHAHNLFCPRDEIQDKEKVAEEWLKEGLRLQRGGQYQSSIDFYRAAISFKPDFIDAYYNMGIAYGSLQDEGFKTVASAIGALKQAIRIKEDFIHAYIALGASFIKAERFEEAIQTLNTAIQYDSNNPDVYYYLGLVQRLTGNVDAAIDALKKMISISPDSVQARYSMGLAYLDGKQFEEASDAFQEALKIKPDFADVHLLLGNLYQSPLTDIERSTFHLKKAEKLFAKLEDYPNSARARHLLENQPV